MHQPVLFHYDPSRKGLGQFLGDLEKEVMEVLWERPELPVSEIVARLPRAVAYSSVITVANRLVRKRLLGRRKEGKTYYYRPRTSRGELIETVTRQILHRVSDIATPATVVHFMDTVIQENPETLGALERLIEARRKKTAPEDDR
jgi:predicted transcriptional regulator